MARPHYHPTPPMAGRHLPIARLHHLARRQRWSWKTATGVGAALAYITGRRDILDMHVFQTGRVWINVLEDDLDELDRRIHAAMIAHNISRDDIEGELFVNTADQRPILLAHLNPETGVFEVSADAKALEDGIKDMRIGLTMIDPLVKAHKVTENSNEHMDQLITMGNDMARRTRSALLINTHFRKGGAEGGNRDAFRGGGSLVDGGRINRSLAPMSEDEAQMYKIDPDEAFRYVKIVDAKGNLAPKARATWIRLASIEIDNREVDPRYPAGDNVQAAVAWKPPPLFDGLDHGPLLRIFDALREGPGESWHYLEPSPGPSTGPAKRSYASATRAATKPEPSSPNGSKAS